MALPAGHLLRTKLGDDIKRVLEVASQRLVEGFVVGVPYTLEGEVGPQARRAQGFIRALQKSTDMPVHGLDERFTTFEAEALLRAAGRQPSREKGAADEAAATLILQRFLDQANPPNPPLSKGGEGGI
jgi:putative Holliday junction resolvase